MSVYHIQYIVFNYSPILTSKLTCKKLDIMKQE
jgi:hypothetical protein